MRKQRPENDFRALVERLLCTDLRRFRGAPIVFDEQRYVGSVEFRECHFRGVAHGLAGDARIAGRRQRQNETGLDLARPDRCGQRCRLTCRKLGRRCRGEILRIVGAAGDQRACRSKQARNRAAPCRQVLFEAGRRCLTLQIRGHGGSPHGTPKADAI